MVDVKPWKFCQARHDEVDKISKRPPFVGAGESPLPLVNELASRILGQIAEQVFKPVFAHKRVAFKIEKDVTIGRFMETGEPKAALYRQKLKFPCAGLARLD